MSSQQLAMPFNVSVLARTSAKHGRGLFATARIPKGTPIWRFAAAADCPTSQTGEMVNSVYTRTQLEELAKQDPEKIKEVLWGGYLHDPTEQFIHLVDGGQFTNHSDEPNCGGEWADDPKDEVSIAIRDIEEGEEITDDYSVFQDMSCEWLASLFAAHTPERAAFEDNFVAKKPKGYITPVESD
eukprot:COSAG03_NODE_539_length_7083_cov_4.852377_3_plen_184_part_00